MKKLFFIFFLVTCFAYCDTQAQCAIYKDEVDTGIWGANYDNGQPPYATMDEVKAAAKKECEVNGGKNCKLHYASYEIGWWVVVRGWASRGNSEGTLFRVMLFETENTTEAKTRAENRAIIVFKENGGLWPHSSTDIKSWYVPGKQE